MNGHVRGAGAYGAKAPAVDTGEAPQFQELFDHLRTIPCLLFHFLQTFSYF